MKKKKKKKKKKKEGRKREDEENIFLKGKTDGTYGMRCAKTDQ